jgi:hypothetical protein
VNAYHAGLTLRQTGKQLMEKGISLPVIQPGELIFLNLPDYPGSGAAKTKPDPPVTVTKRVGTNLGKQGIEVAWSAAGGNRWVSYYEVSRNGTVIGKSAKGEFFFDHLHSVDIAATYEVRTVDGDGNRSAPSSAAPTAGDPESHQPLGEFGPTQGTHGWRYEETSDTQNYEELVWTSGGYEGFWSGSGLGRIGRIWMQPSATAEIARTFTIPANGSVHLSGETEKDPSAVAELPVLARIDHNGQQVWPASGWNAVPSFGAPTSHLLQDVAVQRGDTLRFILKRSGANEPQPIIWNPIIELHP